MNILFNTLKLVVTESKLSAAEGLIRKERNYLFLWKL